jgi:two-component system response regulator DevR
VPEKLTHAMGGGDSAERPPWLDDLTRPERKILKLMAEGSGNKEIAVAVFLAEQTVRNYVHRIYEKIGAENRSQAVKIAWKYARFL